jgi:hypothetical protein
MEKKNTLWAVVTRDNESPRLTSKKTWNTEDAAKDDVHAWYVESKTDENCESVQIDDDGMFACAIINGRYESCEAFEVEI